MHAELHATDRQTGVGVRVRARSGHGHVVDGQIVDE